MLSAFRRFVLDRCRGLDEEERAGVIARAARLIAGSPAPQAHERQIVARSTQALADLIAEEMRAGAADIQPLVVANALMGVQCALSDHVRAAVLTGTRGPKPAAEVRSAGNRAFKQLEHELADYAVRKR